MSSDAKNQAQSVQGNEGTENPGVNAHGVRWIEASGPVEGDQRVGTGGTSGAGGLPVARSAMGVRSRSLGGINSQLSTIKNAFLAYVHGHQERLEARLAESKAYEEQVLEQITSVEQQIAELLSHNEE